MESGVQKIVAGKPWVLGQKSDLILLFNFFFIKKILCIIIRLCQVSGAVLKISSCSIQDPLVVACGIKFPNQGLNSGPLHWEHRILGTGPPGKS